METAASKLQIAGKVKSDGWSKDGIKEFEDKKEDEQYPDIY